MLTIKKLRLIPREKTWWTRSLQTLDQWRCTSRSSPEYFGDSKHILCTDALMDTGRDNLLVNKF